MFNHVFLKAWAQCLPEKVRSRELDLELYPTPLVPNRSYGQLVSEADLPSNNRKRKHSEVSETKVRAFFISNLTYLTHGRL